MTTKTDLFERLKGIKISLEHARRFKLTPNEWRSAMTQAEGDIEELLIDYGMQKSEEREADDSKSVFSEYRVYSGMASMWGPRKFDRYVDAKFFYDNEAKVPSYLGKGAAGGGTGFQPATMYRVTKMVERLETNK